MASNDMNSWDENPDELLRRRWQQTFADFEVQPQASARQRVLDSLERAHRRRLVRWVATAGVFLLLIGGVVYQVGWNEPTQPNYVHNPAAQSAGVSQPQLVDQHQLRTVPGASVVPRNSSVTTPSPDTLTTQPIHPVDTDARQSTLISERPSTQIHSPERYSTMARQRPQIHQTREVDSSPGSLHRRQAESFVGPRVSSPPATPVESIPDGAASTPNPNENAIPRPSELTESVSPDSHPSSSWSSLKPRALGYLPTALGLVPRRLSATSGAAVSLPSQNSDGRRSWRPHWFVEAVPLSSFQWMSAPRASAAHLSQVSAPAAFSPTTWGYQVNGGIRFRRWQAYLATGQLRRWAYYTISENQYRIAPSASNPTQLVRQTHAVAENVSLPMVGIGVSQYQSFSRNRYIAELGGQLSYLPTSDQPLAGLRAGLGRQIRLRQQLAAQVGLTVEYGLNRFLNEQQQLVIRPLVVGVSIRLQPPVIR